MSIQLVSPPVHKFTCDKCGKESVGKLPESWSVVIVAAHKGIDYTDMERGKQGEMVNFCEECADSFVFKTPNQLKAEQAAKQGQVGGMRVGPSKSQ